MIATEFDIDNLPNRFTIFRILLVPVVIGSMLAEMWFSRMAGFFSTVACITFIIAGITDYVDGYIARKKNIVTIFGSFLDPVADKFLTVSALIMLLAQHKIHAIVVITLVLREIYITSLRLLALTQNVTIPVNSYGKWKTATQLLGIPFLMLAVKPYGIDFALIGKIFMYIATFLALYSCVQYSVGMLKKMKTIRQQRAQSSSALSEDNNDHHHESDRS